MLGLGQANHYKEQKHFIELTIQQRQHKVNTGEAEAAGA